MIGKSICRLVLPIFEAFVLIWWQWILRVIKFTKYSWFMWAWDKGRVWNWGWQVLSEELSSFNLKGLFSPCAWSQANLDMKCIWLLDPAPSHKIIKNYFFVKPLKKVWIDGGEISKVPFSVKGALFMKSVPFLFIFFLIWIHSMQGWTATMRCGVTRKEAQKKITGYRKSV